MSDNEKEDTAQEIYEAVREEKFSELEILKQSLDESKKQTAIYYDQLLRLKAEFENYRARTEKEKHTHRLWGKEEILVKQINLLDVLEQAYASIQANAKPESIKKGLELINSEFSKMLTSEGIIEIDSLGKQFDPNVHEALEYVDSSEEEGKILGVMMKGYMFNGRMIRAPKVKVAKKTELKN